MTSSSWTTTSRRRRPGCCSTRSRRSRTSRSRRSSTRISISTTRTATRSSTDRVNIIGHEFTRQMLLSNSIGMPLYRNYVTGLPPQIDDLKKRLAAESDATHAGLAGDADLRRREQPRLAGRAEADAAQRHADRSDDALSRQPRDPDPVSRPRPHGRRRRRVPAARKGRDDGRFPDGRPVEHERLVSRRVGDVARRVEEARLRHRAARATAKRSPTKPRSDTSRTTCATCGPKSAA